MDQAIDIMLAARKRMLKKFPYFGFRLHQLKLVETTATATMATDGKAIYFNPVWVVEMFLERGFEFIETVDAHEIMHVDGFHHLRRPVGSCMKLWGKACDFAINYALMRDGFNIYDGLYDKAYIGMSAEQILKILEAEQGAEGDQPGDEDGEGDQPGDDSQKADSDSQGGDDAEGGNESGDDGAAGNGGSANPDAPWGEVWDGSGDEGENLSQDSKAAEEREIAAQIFEAVKAHEKIKGEGRGASIELIISGFSAEPVPWHEHLKSCFNDFVLSHNTFARPNRRLLSQGYIMPTAQRQPNGELVVAIDSSYSMMDDKELAIVAGHVQDIVDEINPIRTVIIYCHDTICGVDEFDSFDDIILKIPETGGTEFNPPFNYVEKHDLDPCAMIYFTDGWGDVGHNARHTFSDPDYPVFWATTDRAPFFRGCDAFGEVIQVK